MRIFDTHAHYDSEQFDDDREKILADIRSSVGTIVNVGADISSSVSSTELAKKYDFIYAAVGVHPDSAGELIWCDGKNTEDDCFSNREEIKRLARDSKVVAIGEIGLDYHWNVWERNIQQEAFRWQWKLADELGRPVIIHSRDAAEDTMNIVREFYDSLGISEQRGPFEGLICGKSKDKYPETLRAVMHCYSYSPEQAEEYVKMGLMFGIGGVVTFKNAKKLKEVVDMLPLDRILLETDCPYMAPEPFRGKRNNSGYLTYVAEKIAEIKGIDLKTVYDRTFENAERFFRIN